MQDLIQAKRILDCFCLLTLLRVGQRQKDFLNPLKFSKNISDMKGWKSNYIFQKHNGVTKMEIFLSGETDMEVAEQFREIRNEFEAKLESLKDKNYGSELQSIGITPIVVNLSPEYEESGFFKERKLFKKKEKDAGYRLRINFEKFVSGDYNIKRLLLAKNIIINQIIRN